MAINPTLVGQGFESEAEAKAKRLDLAEQLARDTQVSQDEAQGQEAPTLSPEEQERLLIEGGYIDGPVLEGASVDTPVETLSASDQMETALAASYALEEEAGSIIPGSLESAYATVQAATGPEAFTDPNAQPVDNLERLQRESERTPSMQEHLGVASDLSGLREAVGEVTYSRLDGYTQAAAGRDMINFPVRDTPSVPSAIGTPEFETELESLSKRKVEASEDKPMMTGKKGESLVLSPASIFTSSKLLGGLSVPNPMFVSEEVSLTPEGYLNSPDTLTNQQPYIVEPTMVPLMSMITENFLLEQDAVRSQGDTQVAGIAEVAFDPTAEGKSEVSMARLGRDMFQNLRRSLSQRKGEDTDSYVEDFRNTTPETFEMIGKVMMAQYAAISNGMVFKDLATGAGGEAQYHLTPMGRKILQDEVQRYTLPDPKKNFLFIKPESGEYTNEGQLVRSRSGSNPNKDVKTVNEAKVNSAQVANVIDSRRGTLGMSLLSAALATDPVRGGNNFTHNIVDMGSQRIDKILSIASKQAAKIERIDIMIEELEDMIVTNPASKDKNTKRIFDLKMQREKVEEVRITFTRPKDFLNEVGANPDLVADASSRNPQVVGSRLKPEFYSNANKNLEVGMMASKYTGKPFYHTFNIQSGTTRFNVIQNNSYMNNHLMRGIVGSGVKYQIKPGSNSTQERALLRGFSAMFFNGGDFVPETQIKIARDNMVRRSARYGAVVSLGNKLLKLVGDLNPQESVSGFSKVTLTAQGIRGIEGINNTSIIQLVNADPDLKALFESLSDAKDSHKHTLQTLDYMMALADYDQAVRSGKSFHSSVNAIEVDGNSNGLITMQAMLGNVGAMYRGGVLRAEGEERVLGIYDDVPNRTAFGGKLRDALRERMVSLLEGNYTGLTLSDKTFMKEHGYTEDEIPMVMELITLALAKDNEKTFLKGPLMTFPYGQEMHNLVESVYDTIVSDSELRAASVRFGGVTKAAVLLNDVREAALRETLGSDLVNFSTLAKRMVGASALYGLALETTNPLGGTVTFGGTTYQYTGKQSKATTAKARTKKGGREFKDKDLNVLIEKAKQSGNMDRVAALEAKRGTLKTQVSVKEKQKVFDVTAERGGRMGAVAAGQILPSLAQSMDGTTMAELFSDQSMNALRREVGGDPYILPIFDAVITDLGSFEAVERKINQIFYKNVTNTKMLEGLELSLKENLKDGYKHFSDMSAKFGSSMIDEQDYGDIADLVVDTLRKNFSGEHKSKAAAESFIKDLQSKPSRDGVELNQYRTYKTLFDAQQFIQDELYNNIQGQISKAVVDSNRRRKGIEAEVKRTNSRILQYQMDDAANVDMLDFLPPIQQ